MALSDPGVECSPGGLRRAHRRRTHVGHSGQGDRIGPDLLGVTRRRERTWLARHVRVPDQMRTEHDPIATVLTAQYQTVLMPNLRLSEADVAALLTYLEAQNTPLQTTEKAQGLACPMTKTC